VRAKDTAGNLDGSPASKQWKVDLTKPVLTVTFTELGSPNGPYVPGTWANDKVRMDITCSDPGAAPSGIARNRTPHHMTFGDGAQDVGPVGQAPKECVDRAGNVANPIGPWQVKVDTRLPSCSVSPNRIVLSPTGNMQTVNFTLVAADNLSADYALSHAVLMPVVGDNGTLPGDIGPASLTPTGTATAQVKAIVGSPGKTRTYTLIFWVTDEAGNSRTCDAKVIVR
jgi:hypothetical protein